MLVVGLLLLARSAMAQSGSMAQATPVNGTPLYTGQRIVIQAKRMNIIASHSGKCLTAVPVGAFLLKVLVPQQQDGTGSNLQKFCLVAVSDQEYHLTPPAAGPSPLLLTVENSSLEKGAGLGLLPGSGGLNQRFRVLPLSNGTFALVVKHSRQVVGVNGASKDNGTRLCQWPPGYGPEQQFRLVRAP